MLIFNGTDFAKTISRDLIKQSLVFQHKHRRPAKVLFLLLNNTPVSALYVKKKMDLAEKIGVVAKVISTLGDIENNDSDGIVIQLPLSDNLIDQTQTLLDRIPVDKDIDGLTTKSFELLSQGKACYWPAVVKATFKVIDEYELVSKSSRVVLIGRGWVGQRLNQVFINRGYDNVSMIGRDLPQRLDEVKSADVIISSVGQANLITGDMVKDGVCIFDLGTMIVEKGKSTGDVDFSSVAPKAKFITPVPGGIGPVTVACLFDNLINGVS